MAVTWAMNGNFLGFGISTNRVYASYLGSNVVCLKKKVKIFSPKWRGVMAALKIWYLFGEVKIYIDNI